MPCRAYYPREDGEDGDGEESDIAGHIRD